MCSLLVGECIRISDVRISDDVAPADTFTDEVVKLDVVLNFPITSFLLTLLHLLRMFLLPVTRKFGSCVVSLAVLHETIH
jgi:hypothetical protein